MTRAAELERLAARIELELRAERRKPKPTRPVGRPARRRGPDDHGTERDYQAEAWAYRKKGGPEPCELCKAAHARHERRRAKA